jgi:monoamine oxidase
MSAASPASRCDVVVVGAGIAGLVVADRLTSAGLEVHVSEARDRVGGRLRSQAVAGGQIDLGGTWFWPGETHVLELAHRLGVGVFEQALAGDTMVDFRSPRAQRVAGNPIDVPAYRFARGAQALAVRLAQTLPEGTVRLAETVTSIDYTAGGPVRVQTSHGLLEAAHVVVAMPPALAAATLAFTPKLPEDLAAVARDTAVWMGQSVKAVAVYERPFWRDGGLAGAAMSYRGPFREFHDHSGPGGAPAALFGFANSAECAGMTDAQLRAAFLGQLVHLFGQQAGDPLEVVWRDWAAQSATSPRGTAGPASTTVGFGHRVFQEPTEGRLHWASTETAAVAAGHIEAPSAPDCGRPARSRRALSTLRHQP